MKRFSNRVLVALGLLPVALIGFALAKSGALNGKLGVIRSGQQPTATQTATSRRNSVEDDQKVERLKSIARETPAVANRQVVDIMREAAHTKRDEALPHLIRALVYNFDPDNQNEFRTPEMLLPAVQLLKENYGEKAVPALYREAVNSNQKWYSNRIAIAVRAILSPADIQIANGKYLRSASAPDFLAALTTEKVELFLAHSNGRNSEKLEEIRKAKQKNGNL